MWGIIGLYNINGYVPFAQKEFETSLFQLKHHGPDASGIKKFAD